MNAIGQRFNTKWMAELAVYHVHSYKSRVLAGCAPDRDMLQEMMIWVIENRKILHDIIMC